MEGFASIGQRGLTSCRVMLDLFLALLQGRVVLAAITRFL